MIRNLIPLVGLLLTSVVSGDFTTYQSNPTVGTLFVEQDGLTVYQTSGNLGLTVSFDSVNQGKHYWETTAECGPDTWGFTIGALRAGQSSELFNSQFSYGIAGDGARKSNNGTSVMFSDGFLPTMPGDVFMIALDMDAGEIYFGKNGTWLGNANPENMTNPAYTGVAGDMKAVVYIASRECDPNTLVTNFGQSEFSYEVPEGYFKGFCSDGNCSKSGSIVVELAAPELAECSQPNASSIQASAVIFENPADPSVLTQWFLDGESQGYGDNIEITAPLGDSTLLVEVTSQTGEIASDSKVITVEDTTPPDIIAQFTDKKGNEITGNRRKHKKHVYFAHSASDVCDPDVVSAGIMGIQLDSVTKLKFHKKKDKIGISSNNFTIAVSAEDSSGNQASRDISVPVFGDGQEVEDDDTED
jgi:hypothetical protein